MLLLASADRTGRLLQRKPNAFPARSAQSLLSLEECIGPHVVNRNGERQDDLFRLPKVGATPSLRINISGHAVMGRPRRHMAYGTRVEVGKSVGRMPGSKGWATPSTMC